MGAAWWETFFSGLWLDVQRSTWSAEDSREAAHTLIEALELPPGARVLDVPCGDGRLALELAAAGMRVVGCDACAPLLAVAAESAVARRVQVAWEQHDMRALPHEGAFDAVVCFWGSLGYFDDDGNRDQVAGMARALVPGGRVVIDTHVMETLLPGYEPQGWRRAGDVYVLEERHLDHERGRIECRWTFMRGGTVEERISSIRLYTYAELCTLLEEAGFGNFEGYGSLALEPFEVGATRLLLTATRL